MKKEQNPLGIPKENLEIDSNIFYKLKPKTLEVLANVKKTTGFPLKVRSMTDKSLISVSGGLDDAMGLAREAVLTYGEGNIIEYNPNYLDHINHTLLHESVHIIRRSQTKFEEREIPVVAKKHLNALKVSLDKDPWLKEDLVKKLNELCKENKILTSEIDIPGTLLEWVEDTVWLLIRTSEDIQVEREIYDKYPEIRNEQAKCLNYSMKKAPLIFAESGYKKDYPSIFCRKRLILTSTYIAFVANITKDNSIINKIKGLEEFKFGSELLKDIMNSYILDYSRDHIIVDEWAKKLDMNFWYNWIPLRFCKSLKS